MTLKKHMQQHPINHTMQKLLQMETKQVLKRTESPCFAIGLQQVWETQFCFVRERCCPGNAFHVSKTTLKDFYNIDKRELLLTEKAIPLQKAFISTHTWFITQV